MDIRKIKTLIELLEASDLAEIEITEKDGSLRISRNATQTYAPSTVEATQKTNTSSSITNAGDS